MTKPKPRETRAQRDERIVAEFKWEAASASLLPLAKNHGDTWQYYRRHDAALAAARILNRLRARGRKK